MEKHLQKEGSVVVCAETLMKKLSSELSYSINLLELERIHIKQHCETNLYINRFPNIHSTKSGINTQLIRIFFLSK
jgi:hypothetical protein